MVDLFNTFESDKLEYKRELPSNKKLAIEVIAMANSKGGKIVIGYDEQDRSIVGCDLSQKIEEKIANIIQSLCSPQISYFLAFKTYENKTVIILDVPEGPSKPYYLKNQEMVNGTYIRVGSTSRKADQDTLARLIRQGKNLSFDFEHTSIKTTLSLVRLKKYLSSRKARLGSKIPKITDLLKEDLGLTKKNKPTIAGTLLFSENPQKVPELQNAIIRAARFKGDSKGIFIDQAEFAGPITDQIEHAMKFVLRNIRLTAKVDGLQRKDEYEYAPFVIRELITNAVVHREYAIGGQCIMLAIFDDRIEITSPGGLPGNITTETIMDRQFNRNPIIAKRMFEMGYFESWGQGIDLVLQWAEKKNIKRPVFIDNQEQFSVVLFSQLSKDKTNSYFSHNSLDSKIISYLQMNQQITNKQCQKEFGVSKTQAQQAFKRLLSKDQIIRIGAGRAVYYN
ncbi:MAG: putative DNA binding domain-containing protein, partial [Bacteriovoracaceae bacterium]|nr:putative DNA binding domain-containing protein [Bacteriovoracaceae bacterium]